MSKSIKTLGDARDAGIKLLAVCRSVICRHTQAVDLDSVIHHVGAAHGVMPTRGKLHFSERMRCPACRCRGMFIWAEAVKNPEPFFSNLGYSINNWDKMNGALISPVAQVSHIAVAHAAFDCAVQQYPGRRLTLQEGSFMLRDSRMTVIKGGRS